MNLSFKASIITLAAFGVAGCEPAPEPFAFDTTYTDYATMSAALAPTVTELTDEDGDLDVAVEISDIDSFNAAPTGTVTYNGAVIIPEEGGGTMIGQLQLDVAFGTNSMDGTAGNFIHSVDGAYAGLLLGNATIDRQLTNPPDHFGMELTGSLSNGGNAYAATLDLAGNFLDDGMNPLFAVAGDAGLDLGAGGPEYGEGAFAAVQ